MSPAAAPRLLLRSMCEIVDLDLWVGEKCKQLLVLLGHLLL